MIFFTGLTRPARVFVALCCFSYRLTESSAPSALPPPRPKRVHLAPRVRRRAFWRLQFTPFVLCKQLCDLGVDGLFGREALFLVAAFYKLFYLVREDLGLGLGLFAF